MRSKKPIDKNWIELDLVQMEDGITTDTVFKLNEQQFIFPANGTKNFHGLYCYNLHSRQFKEFFSFSDSVREIGYCLQFDSTKNRLYGTSSKSPMFIIDLNEGKLIEWKTIKSWHQIKTGSTPLIENHCGNGNLLNVDGNIHLIGGYHNYIHFIWNERTKNFSPTHNFRSKMEDQMHYYDDYIHDTTHLSVIHVPIRGIIVMIGGIDIIWSDDPDAHDANINNIVWVYHLDTNKWEKITILPFEHAHQSLVMTSDEKYIILSPTNLPYVHALDLDDYSVYQSSIMMPFIEPNFMVKTGGLKDELLVVGWIKSLFQSEGFQYMEMPPMYLMTLIAQWYSQEEVHWIGKCCDRHFTINMKKILSSLSLYQT